MTDKEIKVAEITDTKKTLNPLRLRQVSLSNDFYTLCWSCLRTDIWKNKKIGDTSITITENDIYYIKIYLLCFIATILYVLIGIIIQVFTGEIVASCDWDIRILRILLVALVEMNLLGEFRQGLVKLKYVYENEGDFRELWLAKFIPICQIVCVFLSWITLVLFICSEVDPLSMIQDFTGICVFTELDDWIGSHICSTEPEVSEDKKHEYQFPSDLNDKVSLTMKMSKIQLETDIDEDLNDESSLLIKITYFFYTHKVYVYILPLVCLPVEYLYLKFHSHAK